MRQLLKMSFPIVDADYSPAALRCQALQATRETALAHGWHPLKTRSITLSHEERSVVCEICVEADVLTEDPIWEVER